MQVRNLRSEFIVTVGLPVATAKTCRAFDVKLVCCYFMSMCLTIAKTVQTRDNSQAAYISVTTAALMVCLFYMGIDKIRSLTKSKHIKRLT